jgi:hypothetical protein
VLRPTSPAAAAAIAATLVGAHRRQLVVGAATIGTTRSGGDPAVLAAGSLDRMIQDALRWEVADIGHDVAVGVIETAAGGLVVTFDGEDGPAVVERYLEHFRRPPVEAHPRPRRRIELFTATRTGALSDQLAACPDPAAARNLDRGDRVVHDGERFKCVVP